MTGRRFTFAQKDVYVQLLFLSQRDKEFLDAPTPFLVGMLIADRNGEMEPNQQRDDQEVEEVRPRPQFERPADKRSPRADTEFSIWHWISILALEMQFSTGFSI